MLRKSLWVGLWVLLAGPGQGDPDFWQREWPLTNFAMTAVTDWGEIQSGGPPRDGIPALDDPVMIPAAEDQRIQPHEPVIVLDLAGAPARAYPLRYLTWHEIVNDTVAGVPVAVTFCPLCNSALVFDRRTPAGVLSFGVSGKLRHSDMIMYDRQTESWWQQAIGEAIVGSLTGARLQSLPTWVDSWQGYRSRYPQGEVMAQPPFKRRYGRNPYQNYDTTAWPFLYDGEPPPHGVKPLERVVRVGDQAWPLGRLRAEQQISEQGVVLSWQPGQASALDSGEIAAGRDIGSIRVRDYNGMDLPHDVMFAFAFHAFWPNGIWMMGR